MNNKAIVVSNLTKEFTFSVKKKGVDSLKIFLIQKRKLLKL